MILKLSEAEVAELINILGQVSGSPEADRVFSALVEGEMEMLEVVMIPVALTPDEVAALVELLGDTRDAKLEAVFGKLVEAEAAGGVDCSYEVGGNQ